MKRAISWSVAILVLCGLAISVQAEEVKIVGSTTIKPIIEKALEIFKGSKNVTFTVKGGGSSTGVRGLGTGNVHIGMVSRKITDKEKIFFPNIVVHKIGNDGVGVITNSTNAISAITKEQLKKIYTGKITKWNELGGNATPISIYAKSKGHSTLELFIKYVGMKEEETVASALRIESNQEVIKKVASNKNSIGYVSIGTAQYSIDKDDVTIKLLKLDGVDATIENVRKHIYPFTRPLNLLTNGKPTGEIEKIISFIKNDIGREIIHEAGFIPSKKLFWIVHEGNETATDKPEK